ncbi:MAG TPA: NfeD family protein [Jiangellaceae bacterium]|nr:NfeD family protein [Jiangellaceae bacterium]
MSDAFEWIGDNEWALWVGLALILAIIETTTLDLVFLMLAVGAAGGAVAAALGAPFLVQALTAILVSVAMLGVVRPIAKRHLHQSITERTGVAALVGRRAIVLERVDGIGGRVKLAGEVWSARSYDGSVIEVGANVDVVEIQGATALVFAAEGP